MNVNNDNMPSDDSRFDRLVDGELSERQRRDLLAGLDNEPGGWRRCALAFLEAQCWKRALDGLAGPAGAGVQPRRRPAWSRPVGTLLAMAACFLVAFWVGSAVQHVRQDGSVGPAGTPAEFARAAADHRTPVSPDVPDRGLAGMTRRAPAAANPWRTVTVSAPAGMGPALRLPAVERDHLDPQWLQSLPPAIPNDVMQAFSRTGHQIEQHRQLVPVPLDDGRQLVMPVDNVKVHYVGNETY